jgi:hypothetical protein
MARRATNKSGDIFSKPLLSCILFCLPAIAMLATSSNHISPGWKTAVWTCALTVIAVSCLFNAVRCGRIHCYITGPFFLIMAVVTLLYGIGFVPLGRNGWVVIGLIVLVGAAILSCLPEIVFGKYRKGERERD